MSIRSFKDRRTEAAFLGARPKTVPPDVMIRLENKLAILNSVRTLEALKAASPGSRLEALAGDRLGQYSMRVNQQWRICFRWVDGDVIDVEFVDYH